MDEIFAPRQDFNLITGNEYIDKSNDYSAIS